MARRADPADHASSQTEAPLEKKLMLGRPITTTIDGLKREHKPININGASQAADGALCLLEKKLMIV